MSAQVAIDFYSGTAKARLFVYELAFPGFASQPPIAYLTGQVTHMPTRVALTLFDLILSGHARIAINAAYSVSLICGDEIMTRTGYLTCADGIFVPDVVESRDSR